MASYLDKVKELLRQFDTANIMQVQRTENTNIDALAQLTTSLEDNLLKSMPIEVLYKPRIEEKKSTTLEVI